MKEETVAMLQKSMEMEEKKHLFYKLIKYGRESFGMCFTLSAWR
jgi:hypothetical protein